jgi:NAD-dependent SIR2 family protein deacetylase
VKVFYQFIASLRQKIRDEVKDTSPTHKFIRTLRDGGRLMRCYTQNIDGLESRDGLVMDMTYGKGNKRRFMKKNYEAPLPEQTSNTDFDAGVEVVQLHGDLDTLRCSYCQRITEWTDEASEIYVEGMAPKCKKCTESSEKRQSTGKRGLSVGTMRPNIVLYGESNPADHIIGPLVPFDIASGPEVLLIMGTSLKVHGLKKVIRDFAKAVHSRKDKGRVIFVNRESPAESIWDGIIDDYVSMDCDDWVQDLRTRREDLWLRQGELDLKVTKPATKRKRKSTDSDTTQPAKRQKITVEIPKRVMTPKKARANATMAITNMLNPGPTPGKRRPPPLFTPEMQLKHTLQQAQPDEAVDTPSKSRTWKRPNIDSPTRRILSPLAQQQRPDYSPIGQPQFTVHPDEQNHLTKSRTFKKPNIDSPTRKMLSPLMQRQPSFSPLHMSFKPFKRTECTIMLKSPERPEWSPISTPVRTPSKSKLRVFRDVDEAGGPEIQESDQEEDNEARRAREGSVKENSVPDIESESTETEPGVEAVGIGMLPMARSTRSRRQLT